MVLYFYLHVFVGRMASSIQRKRVGFNLTRYLILTLKERSYVKIRLIKCPLENVLNIYDGESLIKTRSSLTKLHTKLPY